MYLVKFQKFQLKVKANDSFEKGNSNKDTTLLKSRRVDSKSEKNGLGQIIEI